MSHNRESFGGMDYQWENKHGPVNPQSPFVTAVQQPAKKRTHSVFDSPSKSGGFSTPNCPQLREPNSQHHFFSQQNKPPPYIPAHVQNSKTWEPRTPASVIDFSSGGETPNTPAQDSDAATPDTQMASKMGRLMSGDGKGTPKKSRRESIMNWVRSSPSPSKEKAKDDSRNYYSKKAEHRIMKRRSKKSKAALRDDDSDNEQTGNNNASALQEKPPLGFAAHIPGVLSWVEAHPHLPAVLSFYMQFIVNAAIGFMFLYIIYAGWSAVTNDINIEADKMSHDILHEIALCAKDYKDNYCGSKGRAPALEAACLNWETCMNRDAKKVARASVGAKTFAMIFNAFVEEFSYKSMLFTAIIIFGGFNLSNWAFGFIREKHQHPHQQPQHHDYPPPPATPQRYPSGGFLEHQQQGWHTPYHTPYGSMNQHMVQQASQSLPALPSTVEDGSVSLREGRRSPSKRGLFR